MTQSGVGHSLLFWARLLAAVLALPLLDTALSVLMGALVAFLFQWAVYGAVCRAIIGSGALALFQLVEFKDMWGWVLGVFLAAGAAIGAVGSGFAIRRFLQV